MSPYELRWDKTAEDGHQGELFAIWAANGLKSGASLEVKSDAESWRTGNVYIEKQCRVSGQWVPSGIDARHTQAELWAHVVAGPIVIFAPAAFVRHAAERYGKQKEVPATKTTHPTRGLVVPIRLFIAALIALGERWAETDGEAPSPAADPEAPLGRDGNGSPAAPYGYTKDRRVRLQPGGRRAGGKPIPDEIPLWGEPGRSRLDSPPYEPPWDTPLPPSVPG